MPDKDTHYIECDCHDMDHTSRIWYDEEDWTFEFEYKLTRFPQGDGQPYNGLTYTTSSSDSFLLKFFNFSRFKFSCFRNYLKCIWWSIKGRPVWFVSYASFNRDEAVDLIKFMTRKMNLELEQINDLIKLLNQKSGSPKISKFDYMGNNDG